MKRYIKELFYSSVMVIASLGISSDTEARVTKEVAEAVLPYLMEAAGMPADQRTENHQVAILDMIYTDVGQQQMVDWAVNDQEPNILAGNSRPFKLKWPKPSANKDNGNEKLFQVLFPCKTGTFTSFANHASRFGYAVLTKYESVKDQLPQWIIDGKKPTGRNEIVAVGDDALDCKIARIIFILDIFDDPQQIHDICIESFKKKRISEALAGVGDYSPLDKETVFSIIKSIMDQILDNATVKNDIDLKFSTELARRKNKKIKPQEVSTFRRKVMSDKQVEQILADIKEYSQQLISRTQELIATQEYTCRPVSVIMAYKEGDCVETLYRHLINIAIQDDGALGTLHYGRLPVPLQKYYNKSLSGDDVKIQSMSESGASCVKTHESWKQALKEIAEHECFFGIASASIVNLARTLYYIAFWHEDRTILNLRADTPLELMASFIQAAMNKLAKSDDKFAVKLANVEDHSLPWVSTVVEINDTKLKRLIKIGICNKRDVNFGHAEIIEIKKYQ